jgi:hypothetical protein
MGQTFRISFQVPANNLVRHTNIDTSEGEAGENKVENEEEEVTDAAAHTLLFYLPHQHSLPSLFQKELGLYLQIHLAHLILLSTHRDEQGV